MASQPKKPTPSLRAKRSNPHNGGKGWIASSASPPRNDGAMDNAATLLCNEAGVGSPSTPRAFPKPTSGRIAAKVIKHLGDEMMKVLSLGTRG
jgi:hypothetical protein